MGRRLRSQRAIALRERILQFAEPSGTPATDKDAVRARHEHQRSLLITEAGDFLEVHEARLLERFARGRDVDPTRIRPRLAPVETDDDARLFRYAALHWSVPVTGGFGRRTRFLVFDDSNGKLIGIFALGDPVYNLTARDVAIGWREPQRRCNLIRVMDAAVIGAVQPYAQLLGGKLVALAAISKQTLEVIRRKYEGHRTHIENRSVDARPVLVTTMSALGRSSIYNRIARPDRDFYWSVGWTKGYGHFQLPKPLFEELRDVLAQSGRPVPDSHYGSGPNWKMRVVRVGLEALGLERELLRHGLRREVYVAPTATNWREVLNGVQRRPRWFNDDLEELGTFFSARWSGPRALRRPEYKLFTPNAARINSVTPSIAI